MYQIIWYEYCVSIYYEPISCVEKSQFDFFYWQKKNFISSFTIYKIKFLKISFDRKFSDPKINFQINLLRKVFYRPIENSKFLRLVMLILPVHTQNISCFIIKYSMKQKLQTTRVWALNALAYSVFEF